MSCYVIDTEIYTKYAAYFIPKDSDIDMNVEHYVNLCLLSSYYGKFLYANDILCKDFWDSSFLTLLGMRQRAIDNRVAFYDHCTIRFKSMLGFFLLFLILLPAIKRNKNCNRLVQNGPTRVWLHNVCKNEIRFNYRKCSHGDKWKKQ